MRLLRASVARASLPAVLARRAFAESRAPFSPDEQSSSTLAESEIPLSPTRQHSTYTNPTPLPSRLRFSVVVSSL